MLCFLQNEHQFIFNSSVIVFCVKGFLCCNENGEKKYHAVGTIPESKKDFGFLRILQILRHCSEFVVKVEVNIYILLKNG